jgi:signal transduction histidine kinase
MTEPTQEFPDLLGSKKRAVLFLRWVVIVATSYLLLFGSRSSLDDVVIPLYIVVFLLSNLIASAIPEPLFDETLLQGFLFVFDTLWISAGMYLAGENSPDLFLVYFSVLFLAALGENLRMIIGGCLLIAFLYVVVLLQTRTVGELLTPSVLLRIPFLFGVSTFYGYLVEVAKRERRRAEAAVEHEKFRTDFLATLTHDLQSPLSAIAGFTDLLLQAPGQSILGEYRRIFDAIKRGASECGELVANFLMIARGEARPQSVRRQVVDLNTVAEEVFHLHLSTAAEKDVAVRLRVAEGLPLISGDRTQLRRAISNLVGNAIKFVPRGGHVDIVTDTDVSAATLAVIDDGPGIPFEVQGQLFERYGRGEAEASGTGLGLFVVRLVAQAHGGSVTVDSRPGQGARFTLRLPIPADIRLPKRAGVTIEKVSGAVAQNANGRNNEQAMLRKEAAT